MSEYAIKAPVFRNSSFEFPSAEHGALYFARAYGLKGGDGQQPGLIYSRLNNPSVEIFEDKMVAAEAGDAFCTAFPSGMSAITTALLALVPTGGKVLYSDPVYGGTWFLLREIAPKRFGVSTAASTLDTSNLSLVEAALAGNEVEVELEAGSEDGYKVEAGEKDTSGGSIDGKNGGGGVKDSGSGSSGRSNGGGCGGGNSRSNGGSNGRPVDMIFLETPANPTMALTDLAGVAALHDLYCPKPLIAVDNTFLGPVFQRPFEHGEDVVLYSATKFIGGHSDLLAGVVLTKDAAHHQAILGFRTITGPVLAPDTAWMLTRSLETLWMRMERQAGKRKKVCQALRSHSRVAAVVYPGITEEEGSPEEKDLCARQLLGHGSMFTVTTRPATRKAAFALLDALKVFHLAVSLGGTETLVQHPRSMTHADKNEADLDRCGIGEGMLRVSVGLESSKDLIADFVQALNAIAS